MESTGLDENEWQHDWSRNNQGCNWRTVLSNLGKLFRQVAKIVLSFTNNMQTVLFVGF